MDLFNTRNGTLSLWDALVPVEMPQFLAAVLGLLGVVLHLLLRVFNEHWVQDTFKMLLLGTVMESVRSFWSMVSAKAVQRFYVEAHFEHGDFARDWLDDYLERHGVWGRAPKYRVVTRPADDGAITTEKKRDIHPRPIYQSSPDQPEFWNWKGYLVKVSKDVVGYDYKTGAEIGGAISLSVYSWQRHVIDAIVDEAREQYIKSSRPRIIDLDSPASKISSVVTASFNQPDLSYEWMLSFFVSLGVFNDVRHILVSAKMSTSAEWGIEMNQGSSHRVSYMPAPEVPQVLHWKDTWLQVTRQIGSSHWRTGREEGGKITVVMHHGNRIALGELVEAARLNWREAARNHVMIHLADSHGSWDRMIKKSRRSLDSVILPEGIKEMLLSDAYKFRQGEQWYKNAGVPWRRGYLLHGIPGTGKSSTIHALASELMLPIYSISLATRGLDDSNLQSLLAQAPAESLMCLEDIDCAFPRRVAEVEEDEEEMNEAQEDDDNQPRRPQVPVLPPTSDVTLSGLLNALDGVWSEEGRMIFATTNHIENLDPALIRPGRFDIKVHYTYSTREQAARMFARFFPPDHYPASAVASLTAVDSSDEPQREKTFMDAERIEELATKFGDGILEDAFSAATLQAHLLLWRHDPLSAVAAVVDLVKRYEDDAKAVEEARQKAKAARIKARAERAERAKASVPAVNVVMQSPFPIPYHQPNGPSPASTVSLDIIPAELLAGI